MFILVVNGFGAGQHQEASAFDISPTPREPNPFEELASTLVEYDTVDLLSAVAALQFLPQNASRVTRLEALAHSVASLPLTVGPNISASRFRRTCVHRSLEELAYAEDPAEDLFAEEFTFFGGPYVVLPGIAQAGEFMLSNLCKAIFLNPQKSWPQDFESRAFELVASALTVLSTAARNANLRRGMTPVSDRYEKIFVPDAATLQKLKRAACFTKTEVSSLLQSAKLPTTALDRLVSKPGPAILANYDVVNGPLLWRPFLDCGDRIVVMIPGMVVSSVRQELLALALGSNLQTEVAEAYKQAVWQTVRQSLSFTRNIPFRHGTSKPLKIENAIDGFFSLDHDKVLYCLLVTDPLRCSCHDANRHQHAQHLAAT
jgi:hypothetical protein